MSERKHLTVISTGVALALGAAAISGVNNFLTKIAVTEVRDAIVYTTVKNGAAALLLVVALAAVGGFRGFFGHVRRHPWAMAWIGVFGGAVPFALYFTGLTGTTAINAALIHKTMVLWVAAMAVPLLAERHRQALYGGVLTLFAGNLLIGGFGGFKFNLSELMIVVATLLWSVENIVAKKALADIPGLTLAAVRMGAGTLVLLPLALARGGLAPVMHMSAAAWGWTMLTGILLAGYAFGWFAALRRLPATLTAALLVPATLITNVLSAVFVTHKWSGTQSLAAALFAVGLIAAISAARASRAPAPTPAT